MRTSRVALLLLGLAAQAGADDIADAAAAAVKAWEAKDDAALRAIAARETPDPWSVADEIFALAGHEATFAFATAAPRKGIEGLPALVRSWRERPPDPAFREALRRFNERTRAGDVDGAARILEPLEEPGDPLQRARLAYARAVTPYLKGRHADAVPLLVAAAERFREIGALSRQSAALKGAAEQADRAGMRAEADALWERLLAVDEDLGEGREGLRKLAERYEARKEYEKAVPHRARIVERGRQSGDDRALAEALRALGAIQALLGDKVACEASWVEAIGLWERAGAGPEAALTHHLLGVLLREGGRKQEALAHFERGIALAERSGVPEHVIDSFEEVAGLRSQAGDQEAALAAADRGIPIARKLGDHGRIASLLRRRGEAQKEMGDFDGSLSSLRESEALYREAGDARQVMLTHSAIGLTQERLGRLRDAVKSWEAALDIAEAIGDADAASKLHWNIFLALNNILEDHRAAIPFVEREIRSLPGTTPPRRRVELWHRLAVSRAYGGPAEEALHALDQALAFLGGAGDAASLAKNDQLRAIAAWELGRSEEAFRLSREALRRYDGIGDRSSMAETLAVRASWHSKQGDYTRAVEEATAALSLVDGSKDSDAIKFRSLLAGFHRLRRNWEAASAELGRAVELCRILGDPRWECKLEHERGDLLQDKGDLAGALACHRRARDLCEAQDDAGGLAEAIRDIGNCHKGLGEFALAQEHLEDALARFEALRDDESTLNVCNELGGLHRDLGNDETARSNYARALSLAETLGRRRDQSMVLGNLASLHLKREEFAEGAAALRGVVAIKKELGDRRGYAIFADNLGVAEGRLGQAEEARAHHEEALAIAREIDDPDTVILALGHLADCHKALGDRERALSLLQESTHLARERINSGALLDNLCDLALFHVEDEHPADAIAACREAVTLVGRMSSGFADERAAMLREGKRQPFVLGTLAARSAADADALCHFLESGRAATLVEALGGGNALRHVVLPEALRAEEQRARDEEAHARFRHLEALRAGDRVALKQTKAKLDAAQQQLVETEERIRRKAKAAAGVVFPMADAPEAIRGRLRAGEALLLYGTHAPRAVALVLTREGARIVELAKPADIDAACASADWKGLAPFVATPLALDPSIRRLLISPAGPLCSVPFALVFPDHEIAYVASGTAQGLLADLAKERGTGVLALGDPDYGTRPSPAELTVLRTGIELTPLPASRDEAKAVGDTVLLGPDATRARLEAALASRPRWRAVHLACHGLVHPTKAALSSLALSNGEMLTSMDVLRMKIPADLVVLSACETAKGTVYETEGVIGFVRAFMLAGAPRVLVSLWKVDDKATAALMTHFYKEWEGGAGGAAGLRSAQRHVAAQKQWQDPKYWAAWQFWGLPE